MIAQRLGLGVYRGSQVPANKPRPAVGIIQIDLLKSLTPPRHQPPRRIVRRHPMARKLPPQAHHALGVAGVRVEPLVVLGAAGSASPILLSTCIVQLRVHNRLDPLVLWHPVAKDQHGRVPTLALPCPEALADDFGAANLDGMDSSLLVRPEVIVHVMIIGMLEAVHMTNATELKWANHQPPYVLIDLTGTPGLTVVVEVAYMERCRQLVHVQLLLATAGSTSDIFFAGQDTGVAKAHGH